jgi:hypothetical protein
MERRDFFKLLGSSLGTVMLAGCGGTTSGAGSSFFPDGSPIPVGYRFQTLLQGGDPLPDGRSVAGLPRLVQVYDGGVIFVAKDNSGARGVYRAPIDPSSLALGPIQRLLREGDRTLDGTLMTRLDHRGDCSPEGNYAAIVTTSDGSEAVVLARPSGVTRVLAMSDGLAGMPGARFGSAFTGVSLHRGDDLLVCCQFATTRPARCYHGLFHLQAANPASLQVLISTAAPVPGLQSPLTALGLCTLGDAGHYLVQTFGPHNPDAASPIDVHSTALLGGQVGNQLIPLVSHPALGVSGTLAASANFRSGSVFAGPRLHGSRSAYILHTSASDCELAVDSQTLVRTGELSPRNQLIAGFNPPALGPGDQALYQAYTGSLEQPKQRSSELILQAGRQRYSLLSLGDSIGGQAVIDFHFGYQPDQATDSGFLAMIVEFPRKVPALVVGSPV